MDAIIETLTLDNADDRIVRAVAVQANQLADLLDALGVYADPGHWDFEMDCWFWNGPGGTPREAAEQAIENFRLWKKEQQP